MNTKTPLYSLLFSGTLVLSALSAQAVSAQEEVDQNPSILEAVHEDTADVAEKSQKEEPSQDEEKPVVIEEETASPEGLSTLEVNEEENEAIEPVQEVEQAPEKAVETPTNPVELKSQPVGDVIPQPESKGSKDNVQVDRVQAQNRYEMATKISQEGWHQSNRVVLANGEKTADSLTGVPLASMYKAPILFTQEDVLPEVTANEILRLKAKDVTILGGELSVSENVEQALKDLGLTTHRLGGRNRYQQAALVADEIQKVEGKGRDAFLINGEKFADSISASPIAGEKRLPIYLTHANSLHSTVKDDLKDINRIIIIGSELSVSEKVEQELKDLGAEVVRFGGRNRYEVNRNLLQHYGVKGENILVTSGEAFSDSIPVANLAARQGRSVLLIRDNNEVNNNAQINFIYEDKDKYSYTVVGGPQTLGETTVNRIQQASEFLAAYREKTEGKLLTFKKTNSEFLNKIIVPAVELAHEHGLYASVMIAQAALESGWGKSSLAREPNNNLFGIKGAYQGQSVNVKTLEDAGGQNYYSIYAGFRRYPSYRESLYDYVDKMVNGLTYNKNFYKGVWKSQTNSYKDATRYLTGRYATDTAYASKLNNIIRQNNLTQYDTPKNATGKIQVKLV